MSRFWMVAALSVGCLQPMISDAASVSFQQAEAASDPLLWYQLNESSPSTTAVNHGNLGSAFDGTYFNSPTLGAPGDTGDAATAFDSTKFQYVQSATNVPASLTGNPTFTAEALVYIPSAGSNNENFYAPFLYWGGSATGNSVYFSFFRTSHDQAYVGFYNEGLRMTGTFNLDQWNLLTMVRDSNGGTNDAFTGTTLYVNGVSVPLTVDTTLPGTGLVNVTASPFVVEKAGDLTRYFTGSVDEVALYNRAFTPAEVAAHFNALSAVPEPGSLTLTCCGGILMLGGLLRNRSRLRAR